jgi:Zn-dependent M16 (insulinase) family peptidase
LAVWKATKAEKLLPTTNEGFVVPSQVNYVCKGGPIYSPGERVSGASTVVSRHLNTGYLWNSVRVMGGAYGGISSFSQTTGRVSFLSYRDPNLVKTINIYDSAADAVTTAAEEMAAHPEELTMSVIGAVGELDSPMSPDQKGFRSFVEWLTGQTHAQRQQFRNEVLSTSPADFAAFASKLRGFEDSGSAVVFGSQAALTHANEELPEGKTLRIENAIMDN